MGIEMLFIHFPILMDMISRGVIQDISIIRQQLDEYHVWIFLHPFSVPTLDSYARYL